MFRVVTYNSLSLYVTQPFDLKEFGGFGGGEGSYRELNKIYVN